VLVGATAIGIYDLRNTPFSPVYPGVEIHATVIDNALRNQFIHKPKWTRIYDCLTILLLGFFIGAVVPRISAVKGLLFALMLFTIHVLLSLWLFSHYRIWVSMVYRFWRVCWSTRVSRCTTTSPRKGEKEDPKCIQFLRFELGGQRNAEEPGEAETRRRYEGSFRAVLGYKGFTTISEGLTPETLVHLLNEYLTAMTNVVFKYDGTLDKYNGRRCDGLLWRASRSTRSCV